MKTPGWTLPEKDGNFLGICRNMGSEKWRRETHQHDTSTLKNTWGPSGAERNKDATPPGTSQEA